MVVDSHEMGSDETFFFPPEAEPLNPWIWPRTLENRALFGRNTGARFDAAGLAYFTQALTPSIRATATAGRVIWAPSP